MVVVPDTDLARIRRWVRDRNDRLPGRISDQIRVEAEVGPGAVTILECRPPWPEGVDEPWSRLPVARLRFTKARREWSLYWCDQHGKFHRFEPVQPSPAVERLLAEIDADPVCVFWG